MAQEGTYFKRRLNNTNKITFHPNFILSNLGNQMFTIKGLHNHNDHYP